MKAVIPVGDFKKGQQRIPVDVMVDGVTNMASFQFILQFNADVLEAVPAGNPELPIAQKAEFLGSTGRQVVCPDPAVEPGAIRFYCVTLSPKPLGPDGGGKIATIYLNAIGAGKTTLTLDKAKANQVDESSTEIPITVENAPIEVKGASSGMAAWVWALIIAGGLIVGLGAVGAVLMLRSRGGASPAAAT